MDQNKIIQKERITCLNNAPLQNRHYVLYWMQASQRTEYNHALEYAILKANELHKPLIVFFGLTDQFPEANERHYYFMLEGLQEVRQSLTRRHIQMVLHHCSPEQGVLLLAKAAAMVIVDRGYLHIQRHWRKFVAEHIDCPLIEVESDVIVPVRVASPKEEFSAGTFRPKINKMLPAYLISLPEFVPTNSSLHFKFSTLSIDDIKKTLSQMDIDRRVNRVSHLHGGTAAAKKLFAKFLKTKLELYADLRNDPTVDYLSHLSPYLHFGQISPLYVALKVLEIGNPGSDAFLEELIVRRELSMNFVSYNPAYDQFECLPAWAKTTLHFHRFDNREYCYSPEEWENAQTHDPYWNAAQKEMMITGKMHGYMRMYWGKKILEWSRSPEEAFQTAIKLNNKYELDGRDPNGFAGVAWCFGKHDRAWGERAVFGNVRYMNANGLRRKFDADAYVKKIVAMQ